MFRRKVLICSLLWALVPFFFCARAQDGIGVGSVFSPKGPGLELFIPHGDASSSHFRVAMDFERILSGNRKTPGSKLSYYLDFPIANLRLGQESDLKFYSGPGVVTGYLRDNKKNFGIIGGVSAEVGCEFSFKVPVSIRLSFSADFAMHYTSQNKYKSTVTVYNNGYLNAWWPEVGLVYNIGRASRIGRSVGKKQYDNEIGETCSSKTLSMKRRRWSYGAEISYVPEILKYRRVSYINETMGFLVDEKEKIRSFHSNGSVTAFLGYSVSRYVELSLRGGYAGVSDGVRYFPIALRTAVSLKHSLIENCHLLYLELGSGFAENRNFNPVFSAGLGWGYRSYLSERIALDVMSGFRAGYNRLIVYDSFADKPVQPENLNISRNLSAGISFSLALLFR